MSTVEIATSPLTLAVDATLDDFSRQVGMGASPNGAEARNLGCLSLLGRNDGLTREAVSAAAGPWGRDGLRKGRHNGLRQPQLDRRAPAKQERTLTGFAAEDRPVSSCRLHPSRTTVPPHQMNMLDQPERRFIRMRCWACQLLWFPMAEVVARCRPPEHHIRCSDRWL
jgi:hypothetical protein